MNDEQNPFVQPTIFFFEQLASISQLYNRVKEILILSENLDKDFSIPTAPLNELRNALDHLMRGISIYSQSDFISQKEPQAFIKEIPKIEEHLLRAGYDCYELIALNQIDKFQNSELKDYDSELIANVFPQYYDYHRDKIVQTQKDLKDIRAKKEPDKVSSWLENNDFEKYFNIIEELIAINSEVNKHIVSLAKAKQNKFFIGEIERISNSFDLDLLTKVIPDYTKLKSEFIEIKKQSPPKSQRIDEIYTIFQNHYDELRTQQRRIEKKWWWGREIPKGVIFAVVAFLFAIIGIFIGMRIKHEGPFKDSPNKMENKSSTNSKGS